MAIRIQLRRDTAANWTSANPVLRAGEVGIETDTLKFKIGNGSSTWTQITNYANVTESSLTNSLNDYILSADQGNPGGPAELDSNGDLLVPEDSIIMWNDVAHTYTTTLSATQPTADRTITFPNDSGTVALTSQLPTQYTDELAQDAVAAALAAGTHTNITVSYNDNSNAISLTGAQTYSDENAQDAVGNAVGTGLSYNDTTGAISVDTATIQARVADVSDTEIGYLNGVTSAIQTQIDNKLALSGGTMTGAITLSGSPTSPLHAATKAYVDNTTAGLNFHAPAHAATTTNLTATYDNGTDGVGATLTGSGAFPQIDGHAVAEQERVLVKNQSTGLQNGLYVLTDDGDPSGSWVLTRATDADNSPAGEIAYGDFCFIQNGGQAGYGFIVNTTGTITIGTTAISYIQFSAGQVVTPGNGLTEPVAGTLAINTAITADLSTAQTLTNKSISLGSNTVTGTLAQFSSAVTDADLVGVNTTQTLQNKTFSDGVSFTSTKYITSRTSPSSLEINSSASSGAKIDLIAATDIVLTPTSGAAKVGTDVITTNTASQTLTNKTISGSSNTITNIGNASLTNSSITVNGSAVSLGGSVTIDALPSQSGNNGKYLTTDGTTASWATLVVPIETGTSTVTANTATTVDTTALSGFTSIEYMVSLKQGSKIRTSKVVVQTDGTSVDMTEFAITETGGTIAGVVVSAAAVSTNAVLQLTATDAATTNVIVKFSKVKL